RMVNCEPLLAMLTSADPHAAEHSRRSALVTHRDEQAGIDETVDGLVVEPQFAAQNPAFGALLEALHGSAGQLHHVDVACTCASDHDVARSGVRAELPYLVYGSAEHVVMHAYDFDAARQLNATIPALA